jgi:hypothetical protein
MFCILKCVMKLVSFVCEIISITVFDIIYCQALNVQRLKLAVECGSSETSRALGATWSFSDAAENVCISIWPTTAPTTLGILLQRNLNSIHC